MKTWLLIRSSLTAVLAVLPSLLLGLAMGDSPTSRGMQTDADIVVYGGTSGGIAAAVSASRLGKSVILIEPTGFLGGMTTGGLGATDIGNKRCIGGISREFYRRIFKHYQDPAHWTHETREKYFKGRTINSQNEDSMWTFEPHVASIVFDQMLKETNVQVVFNQRLDRKAGVRKNETTIETIRMETGELYRAKVFLDATYEGDLMAAAGVSYHVGREANTTYGETINGLQKEKTIHHQFVKPVDPYITPGDPNSGLLPNIVPMPQGSDGDGDHRLQAYNYRMCTTDTTNWITNSC